MALFHSVSFFCNAGIILFDHGLYNYHQDYTLILTTTALIFIGGLGFITLYEIAHNIAIWRTTKRHPLSLQSKIVLSSTFIGLAISSILFILLEYHHSFAKMGPVTMILSTLFSKQLLADLLAF